jgi:hypothetical protein
MFSLNEPGLRGGVTALKAKNRTRLRRCQMIGAADQAASSALRN